ncbi:MAG TPA: MerR family transcriptional regulator [Thermotogota bacterium]|nr:MerR family transcriptional regulator [Thermotogota bacterium]HPJ89867.1 MerR family transcriptional regulator [Thermotogota bacterium]HPR97132.1 MerR family transcriptional regulator [Thermotogota bacterium]
MTIKEVSDKLGLSVYTLRYYEKEGLVRNVKREPNGFRNYSDEDVGWLDLIMKLKLTRMPLKDLKKYADLYYANDPDMDKRIEILQVHKQRVQREIETLMIADQVIDRKIDIYTKQKQASLL